MLAICRVLNIPINPCQSTKLFKRFNMKIFDKKIIEIIFATLLIGISSNSFAHGFQTGDLYIKHPYSVPSVSGSKNGVVYFKGIVNNGKVADQLLSAKSTVAERAELHEMKMDAGVMKMRPLSGIDIPAGAEVSFAKGNPNGYHVMLMGLKKPLKEGDKFSVWLTFGKTGEVEVDVWVQSPQDANKAEEHKH